MPTKFPVAGDPYVMFALGKLSVKMTWLFAVKFAAPFPTFETSIVQVQLLPSDVLPLTVSVLTAVRSGAVTVKLSLVALARPLLAAVNVNDPTCVGTRFENVAKPLTAATEVVLVPASVPPPLIVTVAVLLVRLLN